MVALRACIPVLFALLSWPYGVAAQQLLGEARHGMSVADVRELFSGAVVSDTPTALTGGLAGLVRTPSCTLFDTPCDIEFFFRDSKLVLVWVTWPLEKKSFETIRKDIANKVTSALGTPSRSHEDKFVPNTQWTSGETHTSLSGWGGSEPYLRMTIQRQDNIMRIPADLESTMPENSNVTIAEFYEMDAAARNETYRSLSTAMHNYFRDTRKKPSAGDCIVRLSRENDEQGNNKLARIFIDATTKAAKDGLSQQHVRNVYFYEVSRVCDPTPEEIKRQQEREAMQAVLQDLEREQARLRERIQEAERNAGRLPDGTAVYVKELANGGWIWVYENGAPVPGHLVDKVRLPSAAPDPEAAPLANLGTPEEFSISGRYSVAGVNPNGSRYSGHVVVTQLDGNRYQFRWTIGRQVYAGSGILEKGTISVDYGDSYPAIYSRKSDGSLSGTWQNGRGRETLTLE